MSGVDLSKYKSLFISESQEHLDAMTQNLLDLERDPNNSECIEELFRHAHSIKGMASSMGYGPIETLSHRLEDMMDDIRKGRAKATSETIDTLLGGHDSLEKWVHEVDEAAEPVFAGSDEIIKRVEAFRKAHVSKAGKPPAPPPPASPPPAPPAEGAEEDFGGLDGEVVAATPPPPQPKPAAESLSQVLPDWPEDHIKKTDAPPTRQWYISAKMKTDSEAPAARAFLALKRIGNLGKFESKPSLEEIRAGKFDGLISMQLTTDADLKKLTSTLDGLADLKEYQIEPIEPEADRAGGSSTAPAADAAPSPYELPHTLRVETRALDRFVNMVGELLTVKSGLRDIAREIRRTELDNRLDRLESLIHELHSQVMDVRMMPLETITARFPRTVRDLAKQAHKEIEFQLFGQDVELDRAILERLVDPLIHLLRNNVDHGIESPEERERLRKPRSGKVTLSASREKDHVAIEVADDGKGIDIEVVKESAIAKSIISAEEAETMTHEEALMLICIPGFSTSEQVTFISGRGVGMDIVKTTIESLGGTLRINTQLGRGTRITLLLPRTVAIMNVLLVRLDPQIFAVPIGKLIRTIELKREDFQLSQRGKMVLFEGEPIPVHNLKKLLLMQSESNDRPVYPALVVEHGQRRFALLVDDFLGQEEAFIRPLGRPLSRIEGLAGVMTRGDGKPVFVLDVGNLA